MMMMVVMIIQSQFRVIFLSSFSWLLLYEKLQFFGQLTWAAAVAASLSLLEPFSGGGNLRHRYYFSDCPLLCFT